VTSTTGTVTVAEILEAPVYPGKVTVTVTLPVAEPEVTDNKPVLLTVANTPVVTDTLYEVRGSLVMVIESVAPSAYMTVIETDKDVEVTTLIGEELAAEPGALIRKLAAVAVADTGDGI
jgi:hypothetical protein